MKKVLEIVVKLNNDIKRKKDNIKYINLEGIEKQILTIVYEEQINYIEYLIWEIKERYKIKN